MPRRRRTPSYRLHKARKCGVVTIDGTDHYLGPYDSPESWEKYYRLLAEWSAVGRQTPVTPVSETPDLTIDELIAAYWQFAQTWYVKDGKPSGAVPGIKVAIRVLRKLYGTTLVSEFGPLKLSALLSHMVGRDWSRTYCNDNFARIKQVFRWGKSTELVPSQVYQDLLSVRGLAAGRSEAREPEPVGPVSDKIVDTTLPELTSVVADMVRFQRLTGARPGEVCILRPVDVDRTDEIWQYRPASHKTQHRGRKRVVYIGPRAQQVLRPYLLRATDSYCFSPAEATAEHFARRRSNRKTPRQASDDTPKQYRTSRRAPGVKYTKDSYRVAIRRACERLSIEPWTPNQLRHAAGTEARAVLGLEAAQVMLGHATAEVTQIYAERDRRLAVEVAKRIG